MTEEETREKPRPVWTVKLSKLELAQWDGGGFTLTKQTFDKDTQRPRWDKIGLTPAEVVLLGRLVTRAMERRRV